MQRAAIPEPRGALAAPAGVIGLLQGRTMGTTWSVQTAGVVAHPDRVWTAVQAALDLVVAQMSHWECDSEISRFNCAAAGARMAISPAFATVMRCALAIAAETEGAFDPALGDLVESWGFGPSLTLGHPAGAQGGPWRGLVLEGDVLVQPGGVRLDLSAIAKGFAVDQVAAVLRDHGLQAFLVEVGGEMFGEGLKPGGEPWWARVERAPGDAQVDDILVALPGWALATSGDYRRYVERDGQRFGHTLDPASGAPLSDRIASVTVLAPDCMRADAYATALTVMGEARGLAFADAKGLAVLFQLRTGQGARTMVSAAWEALWA